jgi:hypothetical protein
VLAHGHHRTNAGLIDLIPLGFSAYLNLRQKKSVFIRVHSWLNSFQHLTERRDLIMQKRKPGTLEVSAIGLGWSGVKILFRMKRNQS